MLDIYEEISNSLLIGNAEKTDSLVREALGKMYPAEMILEQGLVGGIKKMEEKFQSMSMFVPEALMSARALNIGLENLRPYLKRKNGYKCTAILGTVEGDYHDIGKNLVKIYISTLEIKVIDLGVDVSKEEFVEAVRKYNAKLVLISALLTTTLREMELVIKELEKEGLRNRVTIFVGGLPVTESYAQSIGADYFTQDGLELRDFLGKNLDRLLKDK
ncbi:cobalamin-dependent protein [Blautia sp. JLR.GB0024]|uniref:cobalamin B12-binding domain-containing protein n=1 Tax=Blautia sp. JLR.GB0024 TaxID=3123295 RepID=UPI0030079B9F